MNNSGFFIYNRHLPHWRLDDAVYFVTWRVHAGQGELVDAERNLVAASLKHFDGVRYALLAYVVMNDHIHAVVRPYEGNALEDIVQSWKSFTANALQRQHGRVGKV